MVVPHWKEAVVASPLGLTAPFRAAEVAVTLVATFVVAVGSAVPVVPKVAVQALSASRVTCPSEVSPLHPAKIEPASGVAVRVTAVPAL